MLFHGWAKLLSNVTAITRVPVGTHIQGICGITVLVGVVGEKAR
jgi:hypothetical protein